MPKSPPRKLPSTDRRDREFLYLHEVDALIAAMRHTRAPIRNQALSSQAELNLKRSSV